MNAPLSVIIAEDNARDREFLQNALSHHNLQIAKNGQQALEMARGQSDVCIVSDIQMPKLNGIELGREIWSDNPQARIVFWSQFRDEIYLRSLKNIIPPQTVYGYVLKSNTSDVLVQATNLVFNDCQCWIDPKIRLLENATNNSSDLISDAEYEVLVDIALGLTDAMIAERCYLTRRGVQSRLKLLYQKLGVDRATIKDDMGNTPLGKDDLGDPFNSRSRAVSVALTRGLINPFELKQAEVSLQKWLDEFRD